MDGGEGERDSEGGCEGGDEEDEDGKRVKSWVGHRVGCVRREARCGLGQRKWIRGE